MNLERAKKEIKETEENHAKFDDAHVLPSVAKGCRICVLVHISRDLIAEVERLEQEKAELTTTLEAWQSVFGTSQLSHAQERLRVAEECAARLQREKADREQLREAMAKQNMQQEEEIAALEAEVCRMREALTKFGRHIKGCAINPGGPIMKALGDPNPRPCSCGLIEALSSAPVCRHKERADKITVAEMAEQVRLITERDEARQQLAALQVANCAIREELLKIRYSNWHKGAVVEECGAVAMADEALASAPVCPHKEEAELYKALYEEEKEVYALSVAKENELQTALAVGEAGGRLLQAVQQKTEAEVAALQTALDEANGKMMEAEFRQEHSASAFRRYCPGCRQYPDLANRYPDERHSWPRERWTEKERRNREKPH